MLVLLAILGAALVALGALILLRYPDRPGGAVRLAGLEVSSVGAGLPLVALGVLALALAVAQEREPSPSPQAGGEREQSAPPPATAGDTFADDALADDASVPRCIAQFFARPPTVSAGRQRLLPRRNEWVVVLKENEPKSSELGLVLHSRGSVVGAAKMRFDADGQEFLVDGLVDSRCAAAPWTASGDPATPNPPAVGIADELGLQLGGRQYRIGFHEGAPRTIMEMTGG